MTCALWTDAIAIYTFRACGILELTNPYWTFFRMRISESDEIPLPLVLSKRTLGIIFLAFFIPIRIFYFPIQFWEIPESLPREIFLIGFLPLMLLNSYWALLLVRGAIRETKKC